MSKRRRSRFRAPPARKKASRDSIREWPDSLPAPNHAVPLELPAKLNDKSVPPSHRFPLVRLTRADKDAGEPQGLIFVDELYGLTRWVDRDIEAPPTWMDPELFVRVALQDDEVKALMTRGNVKSARIALKKRLTSLFNELYLPYAVDQFASAVGLMARWMLAHSARKRMGKKKPKK